MTFQHKPKAVTSFYAMALAVLVSGCAVTAPLEITSTGGVGSNISTVSLSVDDNSESLRGRFAAALGEGFASHSISVAENAPWLVDFGISQVKASGGIIRGEGDAQKDKDEQDWAITPRDQHSFDKCEAQRLRLTLVIYNRASGNVSYRGIGEAIECDFNNDELTSYAERLIDRALNTSG